MANYPLMAHTKYLDMIKAWGSWMLFQQLLAVLRIVGDRHTKSIANIATRWVLDFPEFVGAVIIGKSIGLGSNNATDWTSTSQVHVWAFLSTLTTI